MYKCDEADCFSTEGHFQCTDFSSFIFETTVTVYVVLLFTVAAQSSPDIIDLSQVDATPLGG